MMPGPASTTPSRAATRPSSVQELARCCGLETSFTDGCGIHRQASRHAISATLQALGVAAETPDDVARVGEARHREEWARMLPPVSVAWDGCLVAELRVREADRDRRVRCRLTLEDGGVREWADRVESLPTGEMADVAGRRHAVKRLSAPSSLPLPLGYHQLVVALGDRSAESVVIAAPRAAFDGGGGGVGVFLPLYALQSSESWGVGDFSDLGRLLDWLPSTGARAFAMLPILAADYDGDPCDPSPYLPVSRLFWNELFVDPRRLPEFGACAAARRLVASGRFRRAVAALQSAPLIDYAGALAAKREVLAVLAGSLESHPNRRSQDFHDWVRGHPLADAYASFRATRERQPPSVPCPTLDPTMAPDDGPGRHNPARTAHRYHLYAQWVADQQVKEVAARARGVGDGLYLDFPLGVHPGGFDVAHYPAVFARGVTTGAPPDELFTSGQNWGTPPPHPEAARRDGYRYLRASLARHLSVAGCLRIDHIMGIHRLYWIPEGGDATDGVYVHYPANEVYAVFCLESCRHRTRLVGENLGTVPPYVNTDMATHRVGGLQVAQFRVSRVGMVGDNPAPQLASASPGAVATLNTHDTATFAGYLDGTDIDDRMSRGLLDPSGAAHAHARRRRERAVLARLPVTHLAALDEETRILQSCLGALARSAADLVLVNLEDLWRERRPQNVPGTGPERPNWRRRAQHSLEAFTAMPMVNETLRWLASARPPRPTRTAGPMSSERSS